jgi:acetyl-CoA synthetase
MIAHSDLSGERRADAAVASDVAAMVEGWLREYGGPRIAVAHLLCDRHAADPRRIALHYEDAAGRTETYTFAELRELSARFAGVLAGLGVRPGDRVATLIPRSPELVIAILGIWRLGCAHVPLFTAFGPDAVAYRLAHSGAKVVVTDQANRPKIEQCGADLRVVTVASPSETVAAGDVPFRAALDAAQPIAAPVVFGGDDTMILIYTSGTTGQPKGVQEKARFLAWLASYVCFGLDLRDDDVYWNISDPGWAYGLNGGITAPLFVGHAALLVNARFDASATVRLLRKYRVTNFAAPPTVYRSLRAAESILTDAADRPRLRVATGGGEPLNADLIAWASESLGTPILDHYGQTESGFLVCNAAHPWLRRPIRPGSMGHPMPGFRVVVVDDACREVGPGVVGQIAVDTEHSPFLPFHGYFQDAARTAERYAGGHYFLTGDLASYDAEGYFTFSGRSDDIINSAGYRIGPFEVESALVTHPAVAEAAVVGKPDTQRGEIVKAFVVLRPGYTPGDDLATELGQFVKTRLAAHAYPREVAFVESLPKTPSGKVQRYLLRGK